MKEISDILQELGYQYKDCGNYYNMSAVYRGGDDPTSLCVYKDTNLVIDFVTGEKFSLESLIKKTLNIDDSKTKEWLKGRFNIDNLNLAYQKPKIKMIQTFDEEILKDLIPDYNYWINRGITPETAELFKGGLCLSSQSLLGKLKNRQILTIYNSQNQIVGFSGRDITGKNNIKWKHLGEKSTWVWPAYLNNKFITESRIIILVESPADILKMWDCNIKNVICLFGTECSYAILNYLLKKNPKKILISTNNEPNNDNIGNRAAEKVYIRLKRYFSVSQLEIKLPIKKDFGEMTCEEINKWYESLS